MPPRSRRPCPPWAQQIHPLDFTPGTPPLVCGEAVLRVMEANLIVGRREMALLDRVREAHRRLEGFTPRGERLPKVA